MSKMGWFEVVWGHPSLSAMSPFDRVHTTSYSSLIETINRYNIININFNISALIIIGLRLSCTVYEI